jgi:hypothetical protein
MATTNIPKRYITGENDPFTGVPFPKIGCLPAAFQLFTLDGVPVAITATSVATNPKLIRLSAINYNKNLLRVGMWLYIQAQDLAVQIRGIDPYGKTLFLDKPFPANLVAVNVFLAKGFSFKKVEAISSGTADAILQKVDFRPGEQTSFDGQSGIAPIAYNANGASAEITFNISI